MGNETPQAGSDLSDQLGCQLDLGPFYQCCCKCENLYPVHYHCMTEPKPPEPHEKCVCGVQKGWACVMKGRVYDNWREHSCGCECYHERKA